MTPKTSSRATVSDPEGLTPKGFATAILGLGSNIGDKRANIARALSIVTRDDAVRLVARSRDYRSAPWGVSGQDWFVNACAAVDTSLAPEQLLARCLAAEAELGRVRVERWGPRVVDCDVLVYDDVISNDPRLTLPHPRITERGFVLVPLADIAPDLRLGGRSVRAWLDVVPHADVVPVENT
jgi:2-amino-4-hydroxy-6-hydroxymethyldihydropteridine diphosphokinase